MKPPSRSFVVRSAAVLVFVVVALYRFNTLGGAFGGFDNDHFLSFIYGKHVQDGEQPLRDFLDAGLQGARPALVYELSAAAQRAFGNTLRSEALLTVTGVALGATATFAAGSVLAPWPVALVTALLSAFIGPKLYSYPKVLALAVAAFLVVRYAAKPTWKGTIAVGLWAAVAFLFRHDLAAYCLLGFVLTIAVAHRRAIATGALRVAACVAIAAVALAPSLWWIERYAGLGAYFRNGLALGRQEVGRTYLAGWPVPRFDCGAASELFRCGDNAEAWVYYLILTLSVAAIVVGLRALRRDTEDGASGVALVSLGAVSLVVWVILLRGGLEGRFGDMAPVAAVLGALLAGRAIVGRRLASTLAWGSVALVLAGVTSAAVWAMQDVASELRLSGLTRSPLAVVARTRRVSADLGALPASVWSSDDTDPTMQAVRYLRSCTRPTDRVLVMAYAPEVIVFADRRFAGGRAAFVPGFFMTEQHARLTLARLAVESAPIALVESDSHYESFPLIGEYMRARYEDAGTLVIGGDRTLRVMVDRTRVPASTRSAGRPCFQ